MCLFFMSTATNAQCFWKQTGIRKRLISWIVSTYNTRLEFYLTTFIKYLVFLKVLHELPDFTKLKIKKCAIRNHKYFKSLLWPAYKGLNKNDSNLNEKKEIKSINLCLNIIYRNLVTDLLIACKTKYCVMQSPIMNDLISNIFSLFLK